MFYNNPGLNLQQESFAIDNSL